ncbi:hypothetical protein JCM6882_005942 [Rhodosporidiobolus microsporus]
MVHDLEILVAEISRRGAVFKAVLKRGSTIVATGTRSPSGLYLLNGELLATSPSDSVTGLRLAEEQGGSEGCNVCHIAQSSRLLFHDSASHAAAPLALVHSDLLTVNVPSNGGRRYLVTFINDHSRMLWVEALGRKSDVLGAFQRFKALVEEESGKMIQRFRSDNGGEYIGTAFKAFLDEHGIQHEATTPYSPQSNGVAERVNRSIVEGILSFLSQSGAPKELWAEAAAAFAFVKCPSPHAVLGGKAPLSVWRGRPANFTMLRTWGCRAWRTVTKLRAKLDDKAVPLVFVGYNSGSAAYRLYDPATKRTFRSRDVPVVEHEFPMSTSPSLPAPTPPGPAVTFPARTSQRLHLSTRPPLSRRLSVPSPPKVKAPIRVASLLPATPPPCLGFARAAAPSPPPPPSPDQLDFLSDPLNSTPAEVEVFMADTGSNKGGFELPSPDPCNRREALCNHDADGPPSATLLSGHFVYHCKNDSAGKVTQHKASSSVLAGVANFTSTSPSTCASPTALTATDSDEYTGKVLKLERFRYGLKQAGRVWNLHMHATLESLRGGLRKAYGIKDVGDAEYRAYLEDLRAAPKDYTPPAGLAAVSTLSSALSLTSIVTLLDNSAVVSHPFDPSPSPGQHLRLLIRDTFLTLHRTFPAAALVVQWVPGHVGVEGNERADDLANAASDEAKAEEDALAKRAAPQARRRRGGGFFRREMMYEEEGEDTDGDRTADSDYSSEQHLSTPACVALDTRQRPNSSPRAYTTAPAASSPDVIPDGRVLPKSVSALQQAHRAALLAEWAHRWRTSATGASLRRVDPRPPGPAFSRPFSSLPRRHAVLLTRIRTNFLDLGARRFWLAEGDEGRLCERCRELETREHVVLECEAYEEGRKELRKRVGRGAWTLATVFQPAPPAGTVLA